MKNNLKLKKYFSYCFLFISALNFGQERISLEELLNLSIKNNYQNSLNDSELKKAELDISGAVEFPKTGIFVENEGFQSSNPNGDWKVGISQDIPWPGLNKARKNYLTQLAATHKMNRTAIQAEIKRDVTQSYYQLSYLENKKQLYQKLDSIYKNLFDAATLRYNVGDVAGLDKISAEVKFKEIQAFLKQIDQDILLEQQELMMLSNQQTFYLPIKEELKKINFDTSLNNQIHPSLLVQQQNIEVAQSMIEVQKKSNLPELSAQFFSQSYLGIDDPATGFTVSVAFPLFGTHSLKNKIKAMEAQVEVQESELKWQEIQLNNQKQKAEIQMDKEQLMLDFYEESGLKQSEAIISAASLSYKSGEISFAELSQFIAQAISIKENYLNALNLYNQSLIDYQYLAQ